MVKLAWDQRSSDLMPEFSAEMDLMDSGLLLGRFNWITSK